MEVLTVCSLSKWRIFPIKAYLKNFCEAVALWEWLPNVLKYVIAFSVFSLIV
jgi:hypothetical protein